MSVTLPKTCPNCKTWPCQTYLQQVLIRKQEQEGSEALQCLWAWWVFQKPICNPSDGRPMMKNGIVSGSTMPKRLTVEDCSRVSRLHRAKKCSLLLPTLTHTPSLIFLSSSGKGKKTPSYPKQDPQVQGGGPGTAELLCPVLIAPCSGHSEMLEEHWNALFNETCARCCTLLDSLWCPEQMRMEAVIIWRDRNRAIEWLLFPLPSEKQLWRETHLVLETPDYFSRPLRSPA